MNDWIEAIYEAKERLLAESSALADDVGAAHRLGLEGIERRLVHVNDTVLGAVLALENAVSAAQKAVAAIVPREKPTDPGLTPTQRKVLADLLDMASDEFSNHVCNDYTLPNDVAHYQFMQNVVAAGDYPGDDPNIIENKIYTMDWLLMDYFVRLFREKA